MKGKSNSSVVVFDDDVKLPFENIEINTNQLIFFHMLQIIRHSSEIEKTIFLINMLESMIRELGWLPEGYEEELEKKINEAKKEPNPEDRKKKWNEIFAWKFGKLFKVIYDRQPVEIIGEI